MGAGWEDPSSFPRGRACGGFILYFLLFCRGEVGKAETTRCRKPETRKRLVFALRTRRTPRRGSDWFLILTSAFLKLGAGWRGKPLERVKPLK